MHGGLIFWSFFTPSRCAGKVIALVHARVSITRAGDINFHHEKYTMINTQSYTTIEYIKYSFRSLIYLLTHDFIMPPSMHAHVPLSH